VIDNDLVQLVNFTTHAKGNVLDLVITNCQERIISVKEQGKLGNSDHCIIETVAEMNFKISQNLRQIMCWDRADHVSMRMEINAVNSDREFGHKNAEESWNRFKEILSDCTDKYVPKIVVKSAGKQRWVTQEIVKLIRMKKTVERI
jgi:hypothetical protein